MAKNAYKGLTVELDGNVSDFSRALREAKKDAKGTTSELRELKKALKFDPENAELLAKTQENYRKQIQATEKELDVLKKKEKQVRESGETVSDEAWTKLQNDIQRVSTKLEKLKKEQSDLDFSGPLEQSRKAITNAEKDLARLNKSLKLDPTNTELLTTKQEALERAIEASAKQAETLRKKAAQIGKDNMSTQEWVNLQADISDCEAKAKDFEAELKDVVRLMETEPRLFIHTGDDIKNAAGEVQKGVGWLEGSVETVIDDVEEEFEDLGDTAEKAGRRVGDSMIDAGEKIQSGFGKISRVGDAYTRSITTPIVAAAAATVKTAVDIDTALTDVRKTVDGTEEEYQELKQAAIDFSKVNAVNAADILSLQSLGAQLGFDKKELKEFAEVASGLDIATNMDAEQAATEMAHFANIVGMSHDEIDRYASTIVELGNHTATTESDISAMAQRIAGAGKAVGLSSAEILGMSAALSSLGIEAEAGGTAISTIMSDIDKAVAKGTDGVKGYADQLGMSTDEFVRALSEDTQKFEEFAEKNGMTANELQTDVSKSLMKLHAWADAAGMSADEFSAAWRDKPVEAFQSVLKGIQKSVEEGGNLSVILTDLGIDSIRQLDSMKRLANSGDLLVNTVALANQGWQENTALQKEVENRNESLASKFEMLKNRVTAVADDIGGPLADALLDALEAAEPLFKEIEKGAKTFSSMSKEEQQMVLKAVAAVAALGPLLSIVGRIGGVAGGAIKTLGSVGNALGDIGKLAGGLKGGLIGVGVAAAGVVAAFAISKWMDYQRELKNTADAALSVKEIQEQAQAAADAYGDSIQDITKKTKDLVEEQAENNRQMKDSLTDIGIDAGVSQRYLDIITELSGKTSLTREEQQKLITAVKEWNDITGDDLEIIDVETGKLSDNSDALIRNRREREKNMRISVYEDRQRKAIEEEMMAEENLTAALEKQAKQKKIVEDLKAEAAKADPVLRESYEQWIAVEESYYDEITKDVENLTQTKQNAQKQSEDLVAAIDNENQKFEDEMATLDNVRNTLNRYGDDTTKKLGEVGQSVDDLAGKLYNGGIRAEDLQKVSSLAFDKLWASCNGDVNLMIRKLEEYNKLDLVGKMAVVKGDTSDIDAKLHDLDRRQLKPLTKKLILELDDRTGGQFGTGKYGIAWKQNAAGGYFRNADILNSIPKHADGGILDGATLTSVGWVGEAGAEAIIPLTNKKYMEPFAKAVAGYLPSGTEINLIIDGAVVNANAQIKQQFLDLFADIYRIGGMNRG